MSADSKEILIVDRQAAQRHGPPATRQCCRKSSTAPRPLSEAPSDIGPQLASAPYLALSIANMPIESVSIEGGSPMPVR